MSQRNIGTPKHEHPRFGRTISYYANHERDTPERDHSIPERAVVSAPMPDDPSSYTYATMGNRRKPTITYFGNWKCLSCKVFSTKLLNYHVTKYINSGAVSLEFRALAYGPTTEPPFQPFLGPDADRAARAGLIIWHTEPESYWAYHEYVFAHQPPERLKWSTTDKFVKFATNAGVKQTEKLRTQLEAGKYQKEVKQTAIDAANVGITGTPQLLISGEVVSPFEQKRVLMLIDKTSNKKRTETDTTTGTTTGTHTNTIGN